MKLLNETSVIVQTTVNRTQSGNINSNSTDLVASNVYFFCVVTIQGKTSPINVLHF